VTTVHGNSDDRKVTRSTGGRAIARSRASIRCRRSPALLVRAAEVRKFDPRQIGPRRSTSSRSRCSTPIRGTPSISSSTRSWPGSSPDDHPRADQRAHQHRPRRAQGTAHRLAHPESRADGRRISHSSNWSAAAESQHRGSIQGGPSSSTRAGSSRWWDWMSPSRPSRHRMASPPSPPSTPRLHGSFVDLPPRPFFGRTYRMGRLKHPPVPRCPCAVAA
jgi:hypothetical protein